MKHRSTGRTGLQKCQFVLILIKLKQLGADSLLREQLESGAIMSVCRQHSDDSCKFRVAVWQTMLIRFEDVHNRRYIFSPTFALLVKQTNKEL